LNRVQATSLVCVALMLAFASCSANINNPKPSVKSISPSSATQGASGFTLTVTGGGFGPSSLVYWNGSPRSTLFLDGGQLTAIISPSDISFAGTVTVLVVTPAPGGGVSNTVDFTVNPATSSIPHITSISPSGGFAGDPQITLQVSGSNFVTQSVVTWNGNNRQTSFFSPSTLLAVILQSDLSAAGTAQVNVVNPAPGGGASNPVAFQISNSVPAITTVSPPSATAGGTELTLGVQGSGFNAASIITFNGVPKTTSFTANTQLSASIAAADIIASGTAQIQVLNPAPGGGPSNIMGFSVVPTSTGGGLPELVDVANTGVQADKGIGNLTNSGPSISTNGRFVAFASISTTLVPINNNGLQLPDVFLRDTCLTASTGCVPGTVAVNFNSDNITEANAPSFEPSISGNGRYVAFSSAATNLVTGAANGIQQVYLRDACGGIAGCTPKTILISVAPNGTAPGDSLSSQAAVGSDGRFVVFVSTATNLGPSNPLNAQEVFLRDTCLNVSGACTATTYLLSTPDGTALADGSNSEPAIGDGTSGQFVSFSSTATNLTAGATGTQQVYRRTACVGISSGCTAATALISSANGSTPANAASSQSSISPDGRFVGFASTATNLGAGTGGTQQVFLRDTCNGASGCTAATTLISTPDAATVANGKSESPHVSSNGQFVSFASVGDNLVAADTNNVEDVFVRNTCIGASGCATKTVRASVASSGTQGNGASLRPVLSSDGHFVSYISFASNLVAIDTNGFEDIFLSVTTF
jgi:hypothetical protein